MKKFLFFTFLTLILIVAAVGVFAHFLLLNNYIVFIESFDGGVLTVDSINTDGTDSKYRVVCKYNDPLTVNINPERSGDVYYELDRLTVNGENVTDQVVMLQYKTRVTQKMSITATFKKATPPDENAAASTASSIAAPVVDVTNSTPYLGSLGAYNMADPSIVYDEKSGYYYAFATDNFVVHSKDLINWTGKTNFFETVITDDADLALDFSQFKCVSTWAKTHGYDVDNRYSSATNDRTLYAPDIIKWGDTYYLYFSLSKEENRNESAIFCVSTDDLESAIANKKWTECGLVIASCADDKNSLANAVHPGVFESADGGLYMVYGGSFGKNTMSGGIYLVELDGATGLLKQNSSRNADGEELATAHGTTTYHAGTLVANPGSISSKEKNQGSIISGADVAYNQETGYYYLLLTYGAAEKNQSIRVARAKTLSEPFLDVVGHNMAKFESSGAKNQYTKGLPLLAGYNFDKSNSGGVSYANVGKASPGSPVLFQSADGDWLLGSHSQIYFKVDGELTTGAKAAKAADLTLDTAPTMELRSVIWSSDGWPLALAEAYAGENLSRTVKPKHMNGNWDVVVFKRNENFDLDAAVCHHSQTVSIIDSIAITEQNMERETKPTKLYFAQGAGNTFELLLDGETYTVTPVLCWDWELSTGALTFTGIADNGNTVWGKKSFSPTMGLYTDTFEYLLGQADEETQATYQAALQKIADNPSQMQIDRLAIRLAREILSAK